MARVKEELDLIGTVHFPDLLDNEGHEEKPIRIAQQAFFAMHLAATTSP
jgi:hypothetical protein